MDITIARNFFFECAVINYGILFLWVGLFIFAHDFIQNLNDKIMGRKIQNFDTIHYAGIALYKMTIIFFNLIPWLVLHRLG